MEEGGHVSKGVQLVQSICKSVSFREKVRQSNTLTQCLEQTCVNPALIIN